MKGKGVVRQLNLRQERGFVAPGGLGAGGKTKVSEPPVWEAGAALVVHMSASVL